MVRMGRPQPKAPATTTSQSPLDALCREVIDCQRCPRLVEYREQVARQKRRAFREWEYWGRPLPGFGDPAARLLVIGLAPAAHGGNRTGRIFTGDRSGDWLFETLHRFGFANQPTSTDRDDGLRLTDAYVTAAVRCAPPDNKPTNDERAQCQSYLARELQLLRTVRVIVALGRFAFDAYCGVRRLRGQPLPQPRPQFAHARAYDLTDICLIGSYHPSQRNTQTGMLTHAMFDRVFSAARQLIDTRPAHGAVDKPPR
ncbi:MAG: putative Uracil-DNA glycosylase [Deltaproteobacteria bacterium]|nr:putative Uracil-DNA glycosylase [Deltaproteobacteria bacterium]